MLWYNIIKSGNVSSKQPLILWLMPFAVVLGIDLTEIFDLILFLGANHQHVLLWSLQQSRSFFSRFLLFCLSDGFCPDLWTFTFGKLLIVSWLFLGVIFYWGQGFRVTSVWMLVSCWWTFGVVVALRWPGAWSSVKDFII